jgi:hypothetical protein
MRLCTTLRALAAALLLHFSTSALAATQIVNSSGILTGATGVNVNGTLYDLSFVEGSCQSLFSGCNAPADFNFQASADAQAAAQALLDQVFLDTALGSFDSDPSLTFGCPTPGFFTLCSAVIPYSGNGVTFSEWSAGNEPSSDSLFHSNLAGASVDSSVNGGSVFAVFTLSQIQTGVPEPASWAMMLLGFGAIGAAMRRRRKGITALT